MMQHLRFRALLLSLMHLSLLCVHSARADDLSIVEVVSAPVAEVVAPVVDSTQAVESVSVAEAVVEVAPVTAVVAEPVAEVVAEVIPVVESVSVAESASVVEAAPVIDVVVAAVEPAPVAEVAPVADVSPVVEAVVAALADAPSVEEAVALVGAVVADITAPESPKDDTSEAQAPVESVVEEPAPAPIVRTKSAWALWCHANGDNSLADFIDYNTNNMSKAKINDNILVLVQADRPNDNGTFRYRVTKNKVELLTHLSYEMGQYPGQEIVDGITWAQSLYDFDNLIIDLWGHGSGIQDPNFRHRGILFDDTNGTYLNNQDMSAVMDQIASQIGKKIDIIGTDACLMGALEVGWQIKNSVALLVASETTIPGLGWDYAPFLNAIAKNGSISGNDVAKVIVKSYGDFYSRSTESYTLSAMDLSKLQAVVDSLHRMIDLTKKCMAQNKKSMAVALTSARAMALEMDDNSYVDLWTFLDAFSRQLGRIRFRGLDGLDIDTTGGVEQEDERGVVGDIISYLVDSSETRAFKNDVTSLKTALKTAMNAVDGAILASCAGNGMNKAHGMTIYFPPARQSIHPSYPITKFAQETRWMTDFLKGIMNYR